jgi:exo-beta-1,3-glucanase (GH17 family)
MADTSSGRACAMSALGLDHGNAICYSGYREGQSPHSRTFPSYEEIREDLQILAKNWQYLRLYDCSPHAETVLKVIRDEGLDFKIMLGLDMAAEMSNPHCPWGAEYSDDTLDANRQANIEEVHRLISLANAFDDIVFSVSVGNEASVARGCPDRLCEAGQGSHRPAGDVLRKLRALDLQAGTAGGGTRFHRGAHLPGLGISLDRRRP